MKAVVCQHGELSVADLPEPTPGPGQALVQVLHCGICGSDLHLRRHTDHVKELAVMKEIDLRFVVNHTPLEYRDTLHMIADGKVPCAPLITGEVGLAGVAAAFEELERAGHHAKILVDPTRSGDGISPISVS